MRSIQGLLAAALMAPGLPALAQDGPPAADVEAAEEGMTAFHDGDYMKAEALLRPFALDDSGKPGTGYAAQMWQQTHAAIADWLPPPRRPASGLDDSEQLRLAHATFVDAIDEIVRRARDTRVVILNEDHSDSRGRAFGLEVARALRPLGYDTLAAETLSNDANEATTANHMELIGERGAVLRGDGYYTRDPVFADFFRQALALGYRLMAYESTKNERDLPQDEAISSRERQQADYLYRRTLRDRPDAKVFIYVGFTHATENPIDSRSGGTLRWMATRLKALTGIDPLTIDQTTIRLPDPPAQADDPLVRTLAPKFGGRSVAAMENATPLVLGHYAGKVDLQVIHPPARVVDGRPDWLVAMGREPLAIPDSLLPTTGERLVQAFAAEEGDKAIPLDQLIVTAGKPSPPLLVPSGIKTRFAYQDIPAS